MRICLVNNLYGNEARGGAERIVAIMAEQCQKQGITPVVISSRPYFRKNSGDGTAGKLYRLPSLYADWPRIPKFIRFFLHLWDLADFITAWRVRRIVKRENCQITVTHNLSGLSLLIPLFLPGQSAHILHDIQLLHPSGLLYFGREKAVDSWPAKAYQLFTRQLIARAATVISPSQWLLNEHEKKGFFRQARRQVLLNPARLKAPENARAESPVVRFLYVGQLAEHKGVWLLAQAYRLYKEQRGLPASELVIAGDGPALSAMKEAFLACPDVNFIGRLDPDGIMSLMSAADCLIVPSLCHENSPTVVYEAAACGLPVLAAAVGGIPELARIFGCLLFTPGNARDLTDRMGQAAADISRIKKRSREMSAAAISKLARNSERYLEAIIS